MYKHTFGQHLKLQSAVVWSLNSVTWGNFLHKHEDCAEKLMRSKLGINR